MDIKEKIEYIIKLLIGIGLINEKIDYIKIELSQKEEHQIDDIVIKLESYYMKQNILDNNFLKNLERINNNIDESIEKTIESFQKDTFNFNMMGYKPLPSR